MDDKKLSTNAKGDRFEEQVFNFLSQEIAQGRLPYRSESCQIFRKKGYFSSARESDIIFDIAIEIHMPGFDRPSIIILIECKNYSGTVSVDNIEEFGSKISQVSGFNAKGIFATTSAFQLGTFNFARNRGLGLLRYFDQSKFRWELPRALLTGAGGTSSRKRAEIEYALTHPEFRPTIYSAYGVTPAGFADGWRAIWTGLGLEHGLSEDELKLIRQPALVATPRVTFVSKEKIEHVAEQVLKTISYIRGAVDLTKLIENEHRNSGLTTKFYDDSPSVLGSATFNPTQIKIFATDSQSPIARFTLAHEMGHHFLNHGRYMARENIRDQDIDQSQEIVIPKSEIERLEWQANIFASCLLMPREEFHNAFGLLIQHLDIRNRGHGPLYLDSQRENIAQFQSVCVPLSKYFGVSKTAVRLRMKALALLTEA